jgi:Polysaccharide deacetylase
MTNAPLLITRRTLIGSSLATAAASSLPLSMSAQETNMTGTEPFWPDNARLAVSFSLMFEGGGQPISGAGGVIPDPIEKGLPDLPTNAFFAYGHYEGIPRVLDLMDKHSIKLSSFMIGKAVETSPDIAKEIVKSGRPRAHLAEQLLPRSRRRAPLYRGQRRDDPEGDRSTADRMERLLDAQFAPHARYPSEPRLQVSYR